MSHIVVQAGTEPETAPRTAPPGPLQLSPLWLLFAALALAIPVLPLLLARQPSNLLDLGQLPAFSLVDQDGKPFGGQEARGRVWIADFIFTSCSDACPRLTARMRSLQDRLDPAQPIGLLSITVDPERDTSAKLAEYARLSGARSSSCLSIPTTRRGQRTRSDWTEASSWKPARHTRCDTNARSFGRRAAISCFGSLHR